MFSPPEFETLVTKRDTDCRVWSVGEPYAGNALLGYGFYIEACRGGGVKDRLKEVYSLGYGRVDYGRVGDFRRIEAKPKLTESLDVVSDIGVLVHLTSLKVGRVVSWDDCGGWKQATR